MREGRPIGRSQSVILPLTAGLPAGARACTRPHDTRPAAPHRDRHAVTPLSGPGGRRHALPPGNRSGRGGHRAVALRRLQPDGLGVLGRVVPRGAARGGAHHRAGRGTPQDARGRQPHLRCAAQGRRRPIRGARHLRRRRDWRHGRLRGRHLHARHPPRPRADDAAGAGRRRDRGQGGRQPARGQEPRRRLLPAVGRRDRSRRALNASPPRVPGRAVRGHQVRRGLRRRAVRAGEP